MIRTALMSVSDKTGAAELGRALVETGVRILSSGGTARVLAEAGVAATPVSKVTGFPEILGGRVKTLHPVVHAGILADRSKPEHVAELESHGIEPIDLVVCNLYPFEHAVEHPSVTERDAIEQIDIGGPAMVRAAAKNFHSVGVVVSPARYDAIAREIEATGDLSEATRRDLAHEAFRHTAAYDAAIAAYFSRGDPWPEQLTVAADKVARLRYGENPHQEAAFYRNAGPPAGIAAADKLHGKELSFNNLLDADAAWRLVSELDGSGAVVIKHSNPCGAAVAGSLVQAYETARDCDPVSAFGGIVALNEPCDRATADEITKIFTEVVLAPEFEPDALEVLTASKNLRLLRVPHLPEHDLDIRRISGGLLVQTPDDFDGLDGAKVVTRAEPGDRQWADLRFAWIVAKHVKSNAIVLARGGAAIGVGAGQMSRVDSVHLAVHRAGDAAAGSVCASDAFFPFRDGVDALAAAGVAAVVQPGGSVRDGEVIAAADEHGIAMVFSGRRHFRH